MDRRIHSSEAEFEIERGNDIIRVVYQGTVAPLAFSEPFRGSLLSRAPSNTFLKFNFERLKLALFSVQFNKHSHLRAQ